MTRKREVKGHDRFPAIRRRLCYDCRINVVLVYGVT